MIVPISRTVAAAPLVAVLSVCVVFPACNARVESAKPVKVVKKPVSDVEEIGWMRLDPGPRPPASMLAVKREDLPSHYRSLYRIKPDRRILYAFAEVDRLLSGRHTPSTISIRFEEGKWRLILGQEEIGSLPEIPTWSDAHRLLMEWAGVRLKRLGAPANEVPVPELAALEEDLGQGTPTKVLAALRTLNTLAAKHPVHPALCRAAAHGTAWLALQTYDDLRLSDPLEGHALALLVLAQSLRSEPLAEDETLLARSMGYETAAARISDALAVDDPVRLWARFDAGGLSRAATAKGATPRTQYLWLLETARRGGREGFLDAFRKTVWARETSTGALGMLLSLDEFALNREVPPALAASAYLSASSPAAPAALWGPEAWPDEALGGVVADVATRVRLPLESHTKSFESQVDRRAIEGDGTLFDRESIRAFYRAEFYSGIRGSARFLLDQYGSNDAAAAYAKSIADPAPGTASELRDWILTRAALGSNRMTPAAGVERAEALYRLGVHSVSLVLNQALYHLGSGIDPPYRTAVKIIARSADTRPGDLYRAWEMAHQLYDLRLMESYARALVDQAPVTGGDMMVKLAYYTGDSARLRRIATDRQQTTSHRTDALVDLAYLDDPDTAFRKAGYLELMREQPENPDPLEKCVNLLRNTNALPEADRVIQEWLDRRPTADHDLPWAHVLALRAGLLARQKKWEAALKCIRPAWSTGKAEVLLDGARYQEALDRWDEAYETAQMILQRYPEEVWTEDLMVRILWRQHRYDEAAAHLAGAHSVTTWILEHTIADSFGEVFATADPHDAQNAFTALRNRKVEGRSLGALAKAVGRRGNHRLAFGLLTSIPASGADESAIQIWCYDELEKTDGREAAAAWLRKNVKVPHQLSLIAFQFKRYDIVWEPLEDPARPAKDDQIQLLRAASLIEAPAADDIRRKTLIEYFEGRPRRDFPMMGLFLLGRASDQDLFAIVTDLSGVSNLGWLMGLRAAGEGCYEEASDWFEVSVETEGGSPPTAWSYEILQRWAEKNRFLYDLAREKAL